MSNELFRYADTCDCIGCEERRERQRAKEATMSANDPGPGDRRSPIIDAVVTSDDWQSDQAAYNREGWEELAREDDDDISDADIGQLAETQDWYGKRS